MAVLTKIYKLIYGGGVEVPYYWNYSISTYLSKGLRKWVAQSIAPYCPVNGIRIFLYRCCGFQIGKNCFIGMKCYLDDMCYDLLRIGNDVTISYGVYFACHGKNQGHYPIIISDKAYIGMRASVISNNCVKKDDSGVYIGEGAIVGACTLVNRDVPDGMVAVGIPCRIIENGRDSERI